MRALLTGLWLLTTTIIITPDGRTVICTTQCVGGQCTVLCF